MEPASNGFPGGSSLVSGDGVENLSNEPVESCDEGVAEILRANLETNSSDDRNEYTHHHFDLLETVVTFGMMYNLEVQTLSSLIFRTC